MASIHVSSFSNQLLLYLFKSQNSTGNLALCGYCIYAVMAILSFGLGGRTEEQFHNLLREKFSDLKDPVHYNRSRSSEMLARFVRISHRSMNFNSTLFHWVPLNEHFSNVWDNVFHFDRAHFELMHPDFSTQYINALVARQTNRTIRKFFQEKLKKDTVLLLINTMNYHQMWRYKFDENLNTMDTFCDDHDNNIEVEMMNQKGVYKFYHDSRNKVQFIFLETNNKWIFAPIVLPDPNVHVASLFNSMTIHMVTSAYRASSEHIIDLKLPKFSYQNVIRLADALKHFNVSDIFTNGLANMSGITDSDGYIAAIDQFSRHIMSENGRQNATEPYFVSEGNGKFHTIRKFHVTRPFMVYMYIPYYSYMFFSSIITNPNEHQS